MGKEILGYYLFTIRVLLPLYYKYSFTDVLISVYDMNKKGENYEYILRQRRSY